MNTDSVYTDTVSQAQIALHGAAAGSNGFDLQFWRLTAIIITIAIGISFILVLIKLLLDHRLKSQMIKQDVPEERIRLILGSGMQPLKETALKWSLTSSGIAAGLLIAGASGTGPALSLGFVAAGIALCFGLYYLLTKK